MAKNWGNKTYDEDFYEINAMGERQSNEKDWDANRAWNEKNNPADVNNFSQDILDRTGGWKGAPGTGVIGMNPGGARAAAPAAAPAAVAPSTSFAWDNTGDNAAPSVTAPTLDAAAMMSQLQGPAALGQVQGPQALAQLGAAPTVASAGPTSQFGQSVQGSIQSGLADPAVNQDDPAYRAQVDAYNRNSQRSAERMRASAAQRANATGTLGSGGFDAGVNRILQNQGAQEADFEAQLMQSELNAGRERQARAQQLGAGLFSQEQQQDLTTRLANQQGALTGMGMNNQRDLSNQNTAMQTLGLNSGRDQANQAAQLQTLGMNNQRDLTGYGAQNQRDLTRYGGQLQAGLANQGATMQQRGYNLQRDLGLSDLDFRNRQSNQQNEQYYSGLGQQLGLETARLNQQALLSLMGGG